MTGMDERMNRYFSTTIIDKHNRICVISTLYNYKIVEIGQKET